MNSACSRSIIFAERRHRLDEGSPFTPGSASLPQSDNFDSDTAGSIAPGWYNASGAWKVGTVAPVASQSFGDTSNADGDVALYSNMAAVADMQVYDEQVLASDVSLVGQLLRMDSGYQNGYLITAGFSGSVVTIGIWKRVSGSYTLLGNTNATLTGSAGWTL